MTPLYRTITLELLQQSGLPATMPLLDRYSEELRQIHAAWQRTLPRGPQAPGQALELAIRDLQEQLGGTPNPAATTT